MCTHSLTALTLCKGLFPFLESRGYDIDVLVGDTEYQDFPREHFGEASFHVIPMERMPHPLRDVVAFTRFCLFMLRNRFDVIHVSTPKASLLAAFASRLTLNGPVLYIHRRQVYRLMSGWRRKLFEWADRFTVMLCRKVVPISRQMASELVEAGVAPQRKICFIGSGSSNGIDTERFRPSPVLTEQGLALRAAHGIPKTAPLLLFVGRLCSEKGVADLSVAFDAALARAPDAHLAIVGPSDRRDPIAEEARRRFETDSAIHLTGFCDDPRAWFAACDVFVFPSYFEGFGNVLLEASAMETPCLAYNVPGVREAVAHGVSGFLVASHDAVALGEAVGRLLADPAKAAAMGQRGRQRVLEEFRRERVWAELVEVIDRLAGRAPSSSGLSRSRA